jgi:hypothetical protein
MEVKVHHGRLSCSDMNARLLDCLESRQIHPDFIHSSRETAENEMPFAIGLRTVENLSRCVLGNDHDSRNGRAVVVCDDAFQGGWAIRQAQSQKEHQTGENPNHCDSKSLCFHVFLLFNFFLPLTSIFISIALYNRTHKKFPFFKNELKLKEKDLT